MKRLALAVVIAACGKDDPAPPSPKPAPDPAPMFGSDPGPQSPAAEAQRIWETGCVTCHGATGRGDGAMAARLDPRPRDHSDPAWQDAVSDAQIADVIVRGGAAIGRSATMPARTDLADQPEVLAELVKRIRGFRR
jgi:mono/diheme cytochrome c family protein